MKRYVRASRAWYTEIEMTAPLAVLGPARDVYPSGLLDAEGNQLMCQDVYEIGFLTQELERE